ncbi:phosphorylase [Allopusillimonas ginsengisoli]|nr:phosphorylase [Allopusillimonas ginsengisoli]
MAHAGSQPPGLQEAPAGREIAPAAAHTSGYLDAMPRIAIVSAFAPELSLLREALDASQEYQINGVTFTTGILRGRPVLLFLSGISMVNAAMNTQLAFDRFAVSHVLFSGIAGGVNPDLHLGDVNVPERWGSHLEVLMAREVSPGTYAFPPDKQNLGVPEFGMLFHRAVRVISDDHPDPRPQFWFDVDEQLLDIARSMQGVALQSCDADKVCLREAPRLVVGGNGLSGTAFVDNAQYREHLYQVFQANVVDMESAACAMVAQANRIPFLAFRSVSDLAGGGPDANEMHVFMNIAAENSARVLMAFLQRWETATGSTVAAGRPGR